MPNKRGPILWCFNFVKYQCALQCPTVRYCGVIKLAAAAWAVSWWAWGCAAAAAARGAVDKVHKLFCSWSTFFCSFSFWVSANLTTRGDEQPSIVWEWCIVLMALIAHCLVENVTKEQPGNYKREDILQGVSTFLNTGYLILNRNVLRRLYSTMLLHFFS